MQKSTHTLSKSRYTKGLQWHKALWLVTHNPALREESEDATRAFAQGHKVGELAQDIFPGGVLIPFNGHTFDEQIQQTQTALTKAKVIYEAAFMHNGVFVKADILRKVRNGWELYEVKGSSKVKDVYLDDAAVQYHVITGAGLTINKAFVVHISTSYSRKGELNLDELFTRNNVTADIVERQAEVKKEIARQKRMLKGKEPKVSIGPWCNEPYECDFSCHCWQDVPEKGAVFELFGRGADCFKLYHEGIRKIADVPLDRVKGQQIQQVQAAKKKQTLVESEKLNAFLDTIRYPLYFLDFETFMQAVPSYDGQQPFQKMPFQYSLHFQKKKGGKLYHQEYLAPPNIDPRKEFMKSLLEAIPENACILVYNKSFESDVLRKLAEAFPKQRKKIETVINNMIDLADPFRLRYLYSWKQRGRYSIKAVLPAFVKELSYNDLEIGDGGAAMEAYHGMCEIADRPKELAALRKELLAYCKLDTLAMVKLLGVVEEKAGR